MTHQDVAAFAQSWGLVFLVVMFCVAVAYALWPSNKDTFERAARMPLDKDENNG